MTFLMRASIVVGIAAIALVALTACSDEFGPEPHLVVASSGKVRGVVVAEATIYWVDSSGLSSLPVSGGDAMSLIPMLEVGSQ